MTVTTDFSKSEQYTLSIRLSTDGFSFSIFNPLADDAPACQHWKTDEALSLTANLKRAFNEIEWMNRTFRRVNVLMADKRFTFVPLELFEDEYATPLFYHNHPQQENERVLYNILPKNNIVVLFGMDKSACTFWEEQHPHVRFYAQASPLIEFFATKSRLGNNRKLYAHLRKDATDLYAYERGRLLLANSFSCKETADRLYYLLYIWKQLGMEQERDELHLAGDLNDKEVLLPELRKFIRQVFVMNPAADLDLQTIHLCE